MTEGPQARSQPPKEIWLLLNEGDQGEHLWCDDPDPTGNGNSVAVKYVRVDVTPHVSEA